MSDTNNLNTPAAGFDENPSAELERIYEQVYREFMQEVPVVNHAIQVEAINFSEWEGHWLGVMLTPWFMNILVIPKTGSPWPKMEVAKGNEVMLSFPQGDYKFSPRDDEGIGSYLSCSLASPVNDWKSHAEAKRTAEDVLSLIKSIPLAQVEEETDEASQEAPCMSRRAFMGAAV